MTTLQRSLDAQDARDLIDAAVAAAEQRGFRQCFAVADPAGYLLAFFRMDGAGLVSVDVAVAKARTAALLDGPSRDFEEFIDGGQTSMLSTPGIVPLRGGVPVTVDGETVGAVGVSGADGAGDEAVALAAADGFAGEER